MILKEAFYAPSPQTPYRLQRRCPADLSSSVPTGLCETGAHVYSHEHREVRTTTQSSSREVTRETTRSSGTIPAPRSARTGWANFGHDIVPPVWGLQEPRGRSSVLEKITDTIPLESREKGILAAFQGDNGKWGC